MKKIITAIVGSLMIYHLGICQRQEMPIILKCDFANTGQVKMSEIISEISYIPLETNPDCLIGNMNIPVFGKDIIIRSYTGAINGSVGIFRFSSEGKFLNKIGTIGRGPGEYQDNSGVVLINDTVFVISNFTNDILCYSINGLFLKRYHLDLKSRPNSLVQLPDKSYMISLSNPIGQGILLKTDKEFKVKTGYLKNIPLDNNPFAYEFPRTREKIYYYYNYLDTIYEISKGYPIPSVIIDYGKYKLSREKLSIYKKNNDVLIKPSIYAFSVSDNFLKPSLYYPFNNTSYTILYRRSDGKQLAWTKLINDVDNGTLDRWEGFLVDNKLIFHLLAPTILDRFQKMTTAEKNDPKNSKFVNMASKITPESNPVIMVCKLK